MLSINTNISSLIAQESMKSSTNKLDQAIERMTTGFKINHAKDNAANYSISTNMTTQLSAYDVAADNVAMGMDLVNTASDIISQMQDKGERLRALATQARNGTYGAQSLSAINSEANAIMAEINRLYSTAEYNGINLFNRKEYELSAEHKALTETVCAKAEYNGFIEDPVTYTEDDINAMLSTGDLVKLDNNVSTFTSGQKYLITDKESLKRLATLVNGGQGGYGATFILGADIDLSGENWTPIGTSSYSNSFQGNFDGNGHLIKNLTIDHPTEDYQGLFGAIAGSAASIRNVGVKNCNIAGASYVGCLVGQTTGDTNNCYAIGNITGEEYVGGLQGDSPVGGSVCDSYAVCDVRGERYVGGIAGGADSILNSYSTGDVTGNKSVGGLVGCSQVLISNSYALGNVSGQDEIGGLIGLAKGEITNVYGAGNVSGSSHVGGLIGRMECSIGTRSINSSASYSVVEGIEALGSLIGSFTNYLYYMGGNVGTLIITDCKAIFQNINSIGGTYKQESSGYILLADFDMTSMFAGISDVELKNILTNLQVGINGNDDCSMNFDTNFDFDLSGIVGSIETDSALSAIDNFVSLLSEKSTMLGAVQNRLDSALESIQVNIDNLTSSRSTIRDADIAEVSSQYIQQQILQQASATLMATANQSPSIALQLI